MTDKLPPQLLALFAPRPPLRYLLPSDTAPEKRKTTQISGIARYLSEIPKHDQDYVPTDTAEQRKEKRRAAKAEWIQRTLKEGIENYDPGNDPQARGDPYCTLFVSRLSYDTTEHDLEKEFSRFGPIERIRIVRDKKNNEHKGYAFIVFEHERDMKNAYKEANGLKIRDRRILVDVERGRTVRGWRPRRLGGGMGGRGYTKEQLSRSGFDGGRDRGERGDRRSSRGGYGERDRERADRGGDRGERRGYRDRPTGDRERGDRGDRGERGDRGDRGDRGGFRGRDRFRGSSERGRYGGIGYRGGFSNGQTGPSGAPSGAPTGPSGHGYQGFTSGTNNIPVGAVKEDDRRKHEESHRHRERDGERRHRDDRRREDDRDRSDRSPKRRRY